MTTGTPGLAPGAARALLAALFTVAVWASFALMADRVRHLPPLLSAGLALVIGGLVGAWRPAAWRAPGPTYLVGVAGLFGYHALLFAAFGLAPAVETNLINYLWPLLIVLLTPVFFRDSRLTLWHAAGAILGFVGAALIVGGTGLSFSSQHALGYAAALAAALVWAVYSLGCRRLPAFPTSAIAACCLLAGVASVLLHLVTTGSGALLALTRHDLLLLMALGLGPMGLSFLTWDLALKHGDPRALGALAYLTPLLSTLLLSLVNGHALGPRTALAAVAILAGAVAGNLPAIRTAQAVRRARRKASPR